MQSNGTHNGAPWGGIPAFLTKETEVWEKVVREEGKSSSRHTACLKLRPSPEALQLYSVVSTLH